VAFTIEKKGGPPQRLLRRGEFLVDRKRLSRFMKKMDSEMVSDRKRELLKA